MSNANSLSVVNIVLFLAVVLLAGHNFFLKNAGNNMGATDPTALAKTYFEAWNKQDLEALGATMDDAVTLRDWDVTAEGKEKVVGANSNIFKAVPAIKIEVLNIFPSTNAQGGNPVAACEILVHVAKEAGKVTETLKVTDVIEFTSEGKVKSVRAYKG